MHYSAESVKRSIQVRRDLKNGVTHPRRKWTAKRHNCACYQNEIGEWMISINGSGGIPATDAEVSLWLDLQEALLCSSNTNP